MQGELQTEGSAKVESKNWAEDHESNIWPNMWGRITAYICLLAFCYFFFCVAEEKSCYLEQAKYPSFNK